MNPFEGMMTKEQLDDRDGRSPAAIPVKRAMSGDEDKRRLMQLLGMGQAGVNQQNELANVSAAMPVQTDYSPLAALADSFSGGKTSYAAGYKAPESPQERIAQIAKLRQVANEGQDKVSNDYIKSLLGDDKNTTNYMKVLQAQADANNPLGSFKERANLDKMTQAFGKDMDTYSKARGTASQMAVTASRAGRLAQLIESVPGGKLDPNEMEELAIGAAALATGGNVVARETINGLLPKYVRGDVAKIKQYILGAPQDAEGQDFIKRLGNTAKREGDLMAAQLVETRRKLLPKHTSLWEHPRGKDRIYNMATQYGIDPKDIDAVFAPPSAQKYKDQAARPELPIVSGEPGFFSKEILHKGANAPAADPQDTAAMEWLKNPANASAKGRDAVESKLRKKGLIP